MPGRCGAGAFDLLLEPRRIGKAASACSATATESRAASSTGSRSSCRWASAPRWASIRSSAEAAASAARAASRASRSLASARGPRLVGERAKALHFGQGRVALGKRVRDRGLAAGKLGCQLPKPISADQPLGGRGAGAGRHEAIPPAQAAVARDQPLANRKHLPLVFIGNRDLPQAAQQL